MLCKKTAIIGGSFNPVHNGHLHLIRTMLRDTDYARILLIPLNQPSHKSEAVHVIPSHRIAMLKLAVKGVAPLPESRELLIETCEIERGGISYTFDTVKHLSNIYPIAGRIGIVIGDDLVSGLSTWYRWDILKKQVDFIIARRSAAAELLPPSGSRFVSLENARIDVSSSQVRKLLAEGKSVNHLVPESVNEYIIGNGLYTAL